VKARRVKKLDPDGPLVENAARILRARLRELRSFVPDALQPDAVEEQHDMRIAAKRLRYVLEVTEFCFGQPAVSARRRARDLQGLLGDIHDCDVMIPEVRSHLDELRAADAEALRRRGAEEPDLDPALVRATPNRTSYRGLEVLIVYLAARRRHLFERFREFWAAQEKAGTWTRLERAAERQVDLAKERRRAEREAERAREDLAEAERAEREARERASRAQAELDRTSLSGT
jgi:hypothetical protein